MPVKLERKLKKKAKALGLPKDRANAFVYGSLRQTGWKPDREKSDKEMKSNFGKPR
jgi:hypothetical protein